MALDFRILKEKKYFDDLASLEPDEHVQIMKMVDELDLHLLKRFNDYYVDRAGFGEDELQDLAGEIELLSRESTDEKIKKKINDLKSLVDLAIHLDRPIEILSD